MRGSQVCARLVWYMYVISYQKNASTNGSVEAYMLSVSLLSDFDCPEVMTEGTRAADGLTFVLPW